jgi:hypothetical protein
MRAARVKVERMTEQERKAAEALAEAKRHYEATRTPHAKALLEVALAHLIRVCEAEMQQQGAA